jgi:acyl-coenzyme A synthetase/AMP-(fatty) acid ligase
LLLDANVSAGRGNREALVEAGAGGRRSLTYSELQRAVAGAATFLTRRVPARSGAAVLIAGSATLETVAFWLAVMRTGNVAVLVHPGERGDYYAAVQQDVRPAVWLGDRTSVCPLAERMPPVTDLCQERAALEPGGAGTGALALLSSGSTGRPKVCVHSHAAFFRFHDAVTRPAWGITSGDRILATSGPYFSFGLQGIHVPLSMGATAVLRSSFTTHTDFLETVESEGVTVMLAVPTLYHLLWQRRRRAYDCSRLRLSLSAGERLPDLVRERWESMTGSVMLDSIGTTETFLPFLSERPGDAGGTR